MNTKASPLVERLWDASALLISAPVLGLAYWLPFAVAYKIYHFTQQGDFHLLGAPTPIGTFNRFFLIGGLSALALGLICLALAGYLRKRDQRAASASLSHATWNEQHNDGAGSHDSHYPPLAS